MERRRFYISWGFIGDSKYTNRQICVLCSEEELDVIATAIGKGNDADSLVVYDKPNQTNWDKPYKVYWDCM